MPFSIKDSEMIVGTLSLDDVAGLPTNDTITGATWATTDIADAGTDVTIATGVLAAATTTDTKATTVTADGTTSPVSDPASNVATVPEQAPPVA
jgi:hypothetical protein